jgi:hypothetical protein
MGDLISEALVSRQPDSLDELYEQMTATALDLRATEASDDWHGELWELVQMARERMRPAPRLTPGALDDMLPMMLAAVDRMGLQFKSGSKMAREEIESRNALRRMHSRLRRIRDNAWLGGALREMERDAYLQRRQAYANTLKHWLEVLDERLPRPEDGEQTARAYLTAMEFWQTLERPSTRLERRNALQALTGMQYHTRRIERCYNLRDRAIFLWEEPPPEPGPEEVEEIRDGILQHIRELSDADPQI